MCAISVNLICATANSNFIQPAESIAECLRTSAGPRQQLDSRGRKRIPQPRRNRKWVHSQLLLQNRKIVRSPHPTSPPACIGSGFCTWQDPRHTARLLRHALPACRGTHCWRRMLGCKPCSCPRQPWPPGSGLKERHPSFWDHRFVAPRQPTAQIGAPSRGRRWRRGQPAWASRHCPMEAPTRTMTCPAGFGKLDNVRTNYILVKTYDYVTWPRTSITARTARTARTSMSLDSPSPWLALTIYSLGLPHSSHMGKAAHCR